MRGKGRVGQTYSFGRRFPQVIFIFLLFLYLWLSLSSSLNLRNRICLRILMSVDDFLPMIFLSPPAASSSSASCSGGGGDDGQQGSSVGQPQQAGVAALEAKVGEYGKVLQAMRNRIVALQVRSIDPRLGGPPCRDVLS